MEGQVQSFPLFQSPVLRFGCLRGGIPGMPGYDPGTMNIAAALRSRCYIDMLLPLFSCSCKCSHQKDMLSFSCFSGCHQSGEGLHLCGRKSISPLAVTIEI